MKRKDMSESIMLRISVHPIETIYRSSFCVELNLTFVYYFDFMSTQHDFICVHGAFYLELTEIKSLSCNKQIFSENKILLDEIRRQRLFFRSFHFFS
jgi:hypothetical protein